MNPIFRLRKITLIEGLSFLILIGVAMPLKYALDMPMAVKIVGWIHGVLFILFCAALAQSSLAARWPLGRVALVFISALLPFGPFVIDRRMMRYASEFETARSVSALSNQQR